MSRLIIGRPSFKGKIEDYQTRFDMVEVQPVDQSLPKAASLRKWRAAVPPSFVFSVVLPRVVGALEPGRAFDDALKKAVNVAALLEARCIVLRTPAEVRPTATNRARLASLFAQIPSEGIVRCWEPSGVWEREDILATAKKCKVLPVFDGSREALPPGSIVYTRLRALGKSTAISANATQRLAERLKERREAYVVVELPSEATRLRTTLKTLLSRNKPTASRTRTQVRPSMPPLVAEDEEQ